MKSILGNKEMFCYAVNHVFAGAGSATESITFSNDSDFILKEIRVNPQTFGNLKVQMSLTNGELFSNIAIDTSLFSAGANSDNAIKFFDSELRIPSNSTLSFELTAGAGLTAEIQLWGYKVNKKN